MKYTLLELARWSFLSVLLLAGPGGARGEEEAEIQYPQGVSKPAQALLMPGSPIERPWTVWINADGVQPRAAVEAGSAARGPRFSFLQRAQVACRYPDGDDSGEQARRLLLVETENLDSREIRSDKWLGWVNESSVIQYPQSQLLVGPDGKKTRFHRKGMAVLKEESAKRFGINPAGELVEPGPPAAEPGAPGPSGEKKPAWSAFVTRVPRQRGPGDPQNFARRFGLFSFYFIYGANKDYVLVGTSDHFEVDRPQDVVLGWLHKSYHCAVGFAHRLRMALGELPAAGRSLAEERNEARAGVRLQLRRRGPAVRRRRHALGRPGACPAGGHLLGAGRGREGGCHGAGGDAHAADRGKRGVHEREPTAASCGTSGGWPPASSARKSNRNGTAASRPCRSSSPSLTWSSSSTTRPRWRSSFPTWPRP